MTHRHRLRGTAAFAAVLRSGHRFEGRRLQLLAVPTSGLTGRAGYVIGKKLLGRAVDRNRLKRMLREAIRGRRPAIDAFDLIVRLRQPCPAPEFAGVAAEAAALLDALAARAPETLR